MGTQVKAFAFLFTVLLAVDAFAYHGQYRMRAGRQFAAAVHSMHGFGGGRDWSRPKPQRADD